MDELRNDIKAVRNVIAALAQKKDFYEAVLTSVCEEAKKANVSPEIITMLQDAREDFINYYFEDASIKLSDAIDKIKG